MLASNGVTLSSIVFYPIRKHLPMARCQLDLRNGASISSPPDDPLLNLFREIWVERRYVKEDLKEDLEVPPGSAIIDIGANVGVFTIWAACRYPHARVIAVEPSPTSCEFLRRNILASRIGNVAVAELACGGGRGEAVLFRRGGSGMNSLYCRDNYGSHFQPLVRIAKLTLDDLFRRFDIQGCELLKLDCEGAEYEILFGASQETLRRVLKIAMEYHIGLNEHAADDLGRYLEARGFSVKIEDPFDEEGGYLYATRRPGVKSTQRDQTAT
jgi:FkbM family methyltransferase